MNRRILDKCALFKGLSGEELEKALSFLSARKKTYARGEALNRPGEALRSFGLVLEGCICVYMDDVSGDRLLMARVMPGVTFGESLCYLGMKTPFHIESAEDSTVLLMDPSPIRDSEAPLGSLERSLCRRFTAMLAERTLAMNDRIQILSKQSIREKVMTLLSQYKIRGEGSTVKLPFNREAMAVYLGVNQSALSRELSRMQRDGLIEFKGSSFTVLP